MLGVGIVTILQRVQPPYMEELDWQTQKSIKTVQGRPLLQFMEVPNEIANILASSCMVSEKSGTVGG